MLGTKLLGLKRERTYAIVGEDFFIGKVKELSAVNFQVLCVTGCQDITEKRIGDGL